LQQLMKVIQTIYLPFDIAIHIAFNKALAVQEIIKQNDTGNEAKTILAADTIVVLENKIIAKTGQP